MSFGGFLDQVGTQFNLPEVGLSELFSGGNKTQNTGRVAYNPIAASYVTAASPALGVGGGLSYVSATSGGSPRPSQSPQPTQSNANDDNKTGTTTKYTGNGLGNGLGGAAPASNWNPSDEANYQAAYQVAHSALNRLPNQLKIAQGNVNNQYNQQYNGLRSGLDQANSQHGQTVTQNQQNRLSNTNQINQGAAQSYQSLLRILGGMGAGGGSEAQFLAPQLVQQAANEQLGQSGQTYAQNARAIDTNYNNFLGDEKNQEKQLNDWKAQQLNSVRSDSATNEEALQQQLAQLAGQRTAAQGGNGVAAEQPYINKINSLADTVMNLQKFNPTFNGKTPVYEAPSLGSYTTSQAPQAQVAPTAQGSSNPYLAMLLGQQQKKDQGKVSS